MTQPPTAAGRSAHPVAGVVLAAGAGRRFGRPKALVELDGERFVDRAVRVLQTGGCDPVIVVSGAASLVVDGALVVENADWQTGMGSSLRRGLAAVPPRCEAAVIALVDQPYVGPEAVRRLISAYQTGATAAVVTYSGRRRNPVLLARSTWEDVRALAYGDVGARRYLEAHPGDVVEVPGEGTGDPRDIDTPADLPRA